MGVWVAWVCGCDGCMGVWVHVFGCVSGVWVCECVGVCVWVCEWGMGVSVCGVRMVCVLGVTYLCFSIPAGSSSSRQCLLYHTRVR